MLPLLGPLLFALLGIGALVIDGGLALSEQARLDAAAETLALEWPHALDLADTARPPDCRTIPPGSPESDRCLRSALLLPLAREFAISDPAAAIRGEPDGSFRLRHRSPLLFGWGALLPQTAAGEDFDLAALQEARARDGAAAELPGRGLRARGFSLEAQTAPAAERALALRVGPLLVDRPEVAGAIGLAWRLDALAQLAEAIDDPTGELAIDLAAAVADPGRRTRIDGVEVGCAFDPAARVLRVGDPLPAVSPASTALPLALPRPVAVAYLPVVEDCERAMLGFIAVSITGVSSGDPDTIALRPSTGRAHARNASAHPGPQAPPLELARVFASEAIGRLTDPSAPWSPMLVRVPHLGRGA